MTKNLKKLLAGLAIATSVTVGGNIASAQTAPDDNSAPEGSMTVPDDATVIQATRTTLEMFHQNCDGEADVRACIKEIIRQDGESQVPPAQDKDAKTIRTCMIDGVANAATDKYLSDLFNVPQPTDEQILTFIDQLNGVTSQATMQCLTDAPTPHSP